MSTLPKIHIHNKDDVFKSKHVLKYFIWEKSHNEASVWLKAYNQEYKHMIVDNQGKVSKDGIVDKRKNYKLDFEPLSFYIESYNITPYIKRAVYDYNEKEWGIDVKLDKSIAKAISQKMPTGTFAIVFSNGKAIVPVNNLIFDNGKIE